MKLIQIGVGELSPHLTSAVDSGTLSKTMCGETVYRRLTEDTSSVPVTSALDEMMLNKVVMFEALLSSFRAKSSPQLV